MRLLLPLLFITILHAAEPDTRLVRETAALTPEQERAALHVPPGFEVQLFASEPMINKPINMAFDARGRLWVSSTVEYPYAADKSRWSDPLGTRVKDSRDAIKILEDTDGDGKADKVTDFADGLNIPTGVVLWHKPEHKAGCIAWSIPNIWYFADTDGDDKADVREVIFGPLGYEKDTHGMCSSFRLGLDGWVYATHGFNNTSRFEVRSGGMTNSRMTNDEIAEQTAPSSFGNSSFDIPGRRLELHSGNVFRFRPDGSKVEPFTRGQVNPFGLCWDRYGNLYSADCHSSPIYQLIRGAHYPSFGKPHDGLGFAPVMCQHTHGSTGICGIVYIDGGVWGPEWDDHTFVGNVVTSKVNHDHVTFTGSTPKANEQPDFLTSDDPWFRPVDLQLGPDNALYIADFYNKIIGHYEVPLEHPGRDKERGRIWRVVKKGSDVKSTRPFKPIQKVSNADLDTPNLTARHLALQTMKVEQDRPFLLTAPRYHTSLMRMNWWTQEVLNRRSRKPPFDGGGASAALRGIANPPVEDKVEILHQVAEFGFAKGWITPADLLLSLRDTSARVRLAAVQAAQAHPVLENLAPLLSSLIATPPEDEVLILATRIAIREHLMLDGAFAQVKNQDAPLIAPIALAVPTSDSAAYLYSLWKNGGETQEANIKHMARHMDVASVTNAINQAKYISSPTWKSHSNAPKGSNAAVPKAPSSSAQDKVLGSPEATTPITKQSAEGATLDTAPAQTAKETGSRGSALQASGSEEGRAVGTQTTPPPSAISLIQAISDGLSERGTPPPPELLAWAQELAEEMLVASSKKPEPVWTLVPSAKAPVWSLKMRKCADGAETSVLQSMSGGGEEESRTGILRSKDFPAPAKLALWINGHRGFPKVQAHDKNLVRVVEAKSGETLASAFPPRDDVCQRIELDLAKHVGKAVRLEIVDGDDGKAYAWLGVTRIEPALVNVNDFQSEDTTREALKQLALMLQHSAPAALREKLAAYLPPRPAPPPLPVSPEQRKQLDTLIASRVAAFAKAKPDLEVGSNVFKMNCAACHQIKGEGGLIGPQLDGIGARGPERLCEDILDPNRNVDAHFHVHTLTMKDGSTFAGFLKAELGQIHLLADAAGKEHRIPKKDIQKTEVTPISLMPPTFGQTLDEATFMDLLGYLLNEKSAK